jgi:hypothetical protein
MGLGLEGAYGVEGAWDSLRNIIAERKKDEILKYKQEEDRRQYELQLRQQNESEKWRELQFQGLQDERLRQNTDRDEQRTALNEVRKQAEQDRMVASIRNRFNLLPIGQQVGAKDVAQAQQAGIEGLLTPGKIDPANPDAPQTWTYSGSAAAQQHVADAEDRKRAQDESNALRLAISNKPSFAFPTVMGPDGQPLVVGVNRRDATAAPVVIGGAAPTGAQRGQQSEAIAAGGGLDQLEKLYKDEYVGPLQGPINVAKASTGYTDDPNLAEFLAQSAAIKNRVIKAITGAQMSETEAKRITAQIPTMSDPPAMWKAKLKATRDNYQYLLNAIAGKSGGGAAPPPPKADISGARDKYKY